MMELRGRWREGGIKYDFGVVNFGRGWDGDGIDLGIEDGNNTLHVQSLCTCMASTPNHKLHGDGKTSHVSLYLEHLLANKCLING